MLQVGISFQYLSTSLLALNVKLPKFEALLRQGEGVREAVRVRNKALSNLLQQLPGVHQVKALTRSPQTLTGCPKVHQQQHIGMLRRTLR